MTRPGPTIGVLALTAALALAPAARAQSAPAAPTAQPDDRQAVETRIDTLRQKLAVTPQQMPDWNNFATVMRDNAQNTDQVFTQRAQTAATMTAVQNMRSYAAITRSYADNTAKLADAFAGFYAKLTPEQQKTADSLFRQAPAAPGPHR